MEPKQAESSAVQGSAEKGSAKNGPTAGAIIVTGASRGLGRGIALELAGAGYSVLINYHGNATAAARTVADCQARAPSATSRFLAVQADIALAADRQRLVDSCLDEFGAIRGLVNNAGIAPRVRADILDASEASFEELLRTNLQGPYFLTQTVARYWLDQDQRNPLSRDTGAIQRHIVFITSISAAAASVNRGDYCVSKAGLAMSVQLWATRLAAEGINVYEIRPGIMETDMTSAVKVKYDALIAEGLVPQRRWGLPDDVGRIVRAIMDGDFAFSTGMVFHADGGFNLSRL
jgi:NAD(P)-dependent dehydrogenase (short-subunit alcohol dehydrogenase family)